MLPEQVARRRPALVLGALLTHWLSIQAICSTTYSVRVDTSSRARRRPVGSPPPQAGLDEGSEHRRDGLGELGHLGLVRNPNLGERVP